VNNDLFIEVSNNYNSEEIFTRIHTKNKGLGMKNIDDLLQQLGAIQRHWTKERRYFVTIVIFNVYKANKCGDN
ncbi:histidine kinase, partial [Enterococcus faecalis]